MGLGIGRFLVARLRSAVGGRPRKVFAAAVLGTALLVGGSIVATADTTSALVLTASVTGDSCTVNQQPAGNGVGLNSLLAVPCLKGNNDPTLFEAYGANAYGFHSGTLPNPRQNGFIQNAQNIGQNFQSLVPGAANIQNDLANALAGVVLGWLLAIGTLCAGTLEWTFTKEMAGGLISGPNSLNSGTLDLVVNYLGQHIYGAFLLAAVVVAGLWVAWYGVARRRMTVVVESLVWVVLATSVAALFMRFPGQAVGGLDYVSLTASQAILGTVSQADPTIHGSTDPVYSRDPGNPAFAGLRAAVDRYWEVYVYKPWEVAEFGSIQFANQRAGTTLSGNKTFAEYDLQARQSNDSSMQTDLDQAVANATANNSGVKDWYEGNHGGERLAIMVMALFTMLIASALLIVIAGSVLLAQLGLILLTMVAPLFFLLGIHPGIGRRIFVRWAELMVGFLLRRVMYSAFLAVILVVGSLIIATTAGTSWGLAAVLQVALLVAAFIYRKPFAALFHQVGTGQLSPYFEPARARILRTERPGRRTATERRAPGFGFGARVWEAYAAGAAEGVAGAAGVAAGQAAAGQDGGGMPGKKVRRIAAGAAGTASLAASGPAGAAVVAGKGTTSIVGGAWRRIRRLQRRATEAGEMAAGSNGRQNDRRAIQSSQQITPLPNENGRRPAGKQPIQLRGRGADDQLRQDDPVRQLRGKRRRDIRNGLTGRDIVPGLPPDRDEA